MQVSIPQPSSIDRDMVGVTHVQQCLAVSIPQPSSIDRDLVTGGDSPRDIQGVSIPQPSSIDRDGEAVVAGARAMLSRSHSHRASIATNQIIGVTVTARLSRSHSHRASIAT